MTDTAVRGFEFRTQGENTGILSFIDAMRGLITRTSSKDTDTMVLRIGGFSAMMMGMMGMTAFLVVTRNEELANILSDTEGFKEREDVSDLITEMGESAFADDGTFARMGLIEGVQSDNYDGLVAEVARETAEAAAAQTEDEDDSDMSDYDDSDDDFEDDD